MTEYPHLKEHLHFFAETLGPRPVGSASYRQAAAYIRDVFAAAGLRLQELSYDCVGWQHQSTLLEVGGERLPAVANVFSPPCDVAAPSLALCTPAELEAGPIAGKILVFYGDLAAEPLIPLNCQVYNSERDQAINRLLAQEQPAAVVAVNLNRPAVDARIEDADQPIPSATVSADAGLRLLARAGAEVRLKIEAERTPAQATTIVGRKDGPAAARITLMAHYDTKVDTPGASDNGGGAAALLALATALSGKELACGLECIAFGDEEYYAYSDGRYVAQYGAEMPQIVLAINMDGVGQRLGTNTIALMAASDACRALLDRLLHDYPAVLWTDPWPQSNHSTFAWRGVPSIAFTSRGVTTLHHGPADTVRWVDPAKLHEVVSLAGNVVAALQEKSPAWTRP